MTAAAPLPPPPPPSSQPVEDLDTIARHARIGMGLFVAYVLLYAGFVLLAAFSFEKLRVDVGGLNLAIVYGFGLIFLAFVLALLYMLLCRMSDARRGRSDSADVTGGRA